MADLTSPTPEAHIDEALSHARRLRAAIDELSPPCKDSLLVAAVRLRAEAEALNEALMSQINSEALARVESEFRADFEAWQKARDVVPDGIDGPDTARAAREATAREDRARADLDAVAPAIEAVGLAARCSASDREWIRSELEKQRTRLARVAPTPESHIDEALNEARGLMEQRSRRQAQIDAMVSELRAWRIWHRESTGREPTSIELGAHVEWVMARVRQQAIETIKAEITPTKESVMPTVPNSAGALPVGSMPEGPSFHGQHIGRALRRDATDAAWRTAGAQFVKLAREPLVALLSRHLGPGDEALRGRIAAFLGTEVGTAILAALLSAGLSAVPATGMLGAGAAYNTAKLAQELRVKAMSDAADILADVFVGPLREVMVTYLQGVPVPEELAGAEPAMLPEGTPVSAREPPTVATAAPLDLRPARGGFDIAVNGASKGGAQ